MKSSAQVLKDTKAYIQEHGWARGTGRTQEGGVCAAVGLWDVLGVEASTRHTDEYTVVARILVRAMAAPSMIPIYNDTYCKTEEDVYAWFDRAIELAETTEMAEEPTLEPVCV